MIFAIVAFYAAMPPAQKMALPLSISAE